VKLAGYYQTPSAQSLHWSVKYFQAMRVAVTFADIIQLKLKVS